MIRKPSKIEHAVFRTSNVPITRSRILSDAQGMGYMDSSNTRKRIRTGVGRTGTFDKQRANIQEAAVEDGKKFAGWCGDAGSNAVRGAVRAASATSRLLLSPLSEEQSHHSRAQATTIPSQATFPQVHFPHPPRLLRLQNISFKSQTTPSTHSCPVVTLLQSPWSDRRVVLVGGCVRCVCSSGSGDLCQCYRSPCPALPCPVHAQHQPPVSVQLYKIQ